MCSANGKKKAQEIAFSDCVGSIKPASRVARCPLPCLLIVFRLVYMVRHYHMDLLSPFSVKIEISSAASAVS